MSQAIERLELPENRACALFLSSCSMDRNSFQAAGLGLGTGTPPWAWLVLCGRRREGEPFAPSFLGRFLPLRLSRCHEVGCRNQRMRSAWFLVWVALAGCGRPLVAEVGPAVPILFEPPATWTGTWVALKQNGPGAGGDATGCVVDDYKLKIDCCGRFDYSHRGGDIAGDDSPGSVTEGGAPDRVLLRADKWVEMIPSDRDSSFVRSATSFHGVSTAVLTNDFEDVLWGKSPDVAGASLRAELAGAWLGTTIAFDYFADSTTGPGAQVDAISPQPADDPTSRFGAYSAQLSASGAYAEVRHYEGGVEIYREGTVDSWSASGGSLRWQNGPGICADLDASARLRLLSPSVLEVETIRKTPDATDSNHNGSTTDVVYERKRLVLHRS